MTDEKTCYNCGNKNCNLYYSTAKPDVKRHFETYEYTDFDCVNHNKWEELKMEEIHTDNTKTLQNALDRIKELEKENARLKAGRPKWHKVAGGDLPKVSGRYWVYTGGEPFTLDFDTEVNAFGYWCAVLGDSLGVCDTFFETVEERKEDEVIAWKEIVLPELKE